MAMRASGWLLLSLAALAVVLAAEIRYGIGGGDGRPAERPADVAVEHGSVPLFALADRDTFSETLDRPLFMPGREPYTVPAVPTETAAPAAVRPSASRYVLSAVIIVGDERIALLTDTATGVARRVREGERVAGWRIDAIHDNSAVLRTGDTTEELYLRTFGPPAPAANRPGTNGSRSPARPEAPGVPKRLPRQPTPVPRASTQ